MVDMKLRRMRQSLKRKYVDKNVWELALERVNHVYDLFDTVAVAFSGGKDSTCVLHVALEVAKERNKLPLEVFFYDEECIPLEVIDYVRRVSKNPDINFRWLCVQCKHTNATTKYNPVWYPWAPEDKERWVRPMPPEAITEIEGYDPKTPEERVTFPNLSGHILPVEKYGNVCQLLGIRAQESMTRLRAVIRREKDNYIILDRDIWENCPTKIKGAVYKAYPIYDWTTEDVWTAINKFGWDYSKSYDHMDKAGLTAYQQRVAPPFGLEPMQNLWQYKVCFPDLWEKMHNRVEGASTGALYARTKLYAFGEIPEKPAGLSWEEAIKQEIQKWPPDKQKLLVKRMQTYIKMHYKRVSDKITEDPHPNTGIGWKYLYFLAVRGDFKNRKTPDARGRVKELKEYREVLKKDEK